MEIKTGFMSRRLILGTSIASAIVFFVVGIIFWGGFNTAMEATNTTEFCISCHEMEDNVYQEYLPSIHYSNRTGVRAGCPDCHVPRPWIHKVVRKVQASNELLHKALGTINTPEKFEEHRLRLATNVWNQMKDTDSRECRNCHDFESMNPEFQRPRARKQHLNAFESGQTCIDCHKGIAHNSVRHLLSDEDLEALEAPNPDFIREVPQMYIDGLAKVEAKEAEEAAAASLVKIEAKAAEKKRIEAAVASALASQSNNTSGDSATTQSASSINVDWSKASSRDVTLFYPGEASIEWVMNGRDHGGARPFLKGGERCVTCHDKETADMGARIVSGEVAESAPIPGKRGSIPVTVESTYDNEFLYMRFSWQDAEHVPMPSVEGGKMDPKNSMKLALMFATDDVEYAGQAGCWGSCHHDARSMPDTPAQDVLTASGLGERLDLAGGVTKYIKESRTKLEVKGRRGKPRGGWDKLKSDEELAAEMSEGHFMDIIRLKAGENVVEDGVLLADRKMAGGQGAEFDASLNGGSWVVIMKRKLKSDKEGDISMAEESLYNIGFAIHDDYSNARFHHVSLGYKLGFGNAEAEFNATKQ
ncbi:NapC/NirT family cytochrome c [Neptunomonas sp.]|uniref:NapC/NirT family cytochrome c n=1 Tax=Neptunomonas sp. TaxID=1971898 RepID=UPI0025EFB431|nr:NapC/NirT family cytochrome c [Neptunomonas sp.]